MRAWEVSENLSEIVAQLSDGLETTNVRHERRVRLDAKVYAK